MYNENRELQYNVDIHFRGAFQAQTVYIVLSINEIKFDCSVSSLDLGLTLESLGVGEHNFLIKSRFNQM